MMTLKVRTKVRTKVIVLVRVKDVNIVTWGKMTVHFGFYKLCKYDPLGRKIVFVFVCTSACL